MMASADHDPRRAGTIWAYDLDQAVNRLAPLVPAAFSRSGPADAARLANTPDGASISEIKTRFLSGRRCYSAWSGEDLAAYGWVSLEEETVGELNLRIRLPPGEAYIWDCYTLPAFRRQHFYSALLSYILDELRGAGLKRAWIGADLDNLPSQLGIERAGFRPVADLVIERVIAMRLVWAQPRPGVAADLVAEARRVFLGDREKVWQEAVK